MNKFNNDHNVGGYQHPQIENEMFDDYFAKADYDFIEVCRFVDTMEMTIQNII